MGKQKLTLINRVFAIITRTIPIPRTGISIVPDWLECPLYFALANHELYWLHSSDCNCVRNTSNYRSSPEKIYTKYLSVPKHCTLHPVRPISIWSIEITTAATLHPHWLPSIQSKSAVLRPTEESAYMWRWEWTIYMQIAMVIVNANL